MSAARLARAREIATAQVLRTQQSMVLENQGLSQVALDALIAERTQALAKSPGSLREGLS